VRSKVRDTIPATMVDVPIPPHPSPGEIAVKVENDMRPFIPEIVNKLVPIMNSVLLNCVTVSVKWNVLIPAPTGCFFCGVAAPKNCVHVSSELVTHRYAKLVIVSVAMCFIHPSPLSLRFVWMSKTSVDPFHPFLICSQSEP